MNNKRVKYIIIGLLGVLLVVGGIFVTKNIAPTIHATVEIANALKPYIEAENQSMHVDLEVLSEKEDFQIDADLYAVKQGNADYLVIEQENAKFYIVDNMLLLENGRAFLLTEEPVTDVPQGDASQNTTYIDIFPLLVTAYEEFEIERTQNEDVVQYQVEITGEQVQKILEVTMATRADGLQSIERLQVQLATKDGKLDEIQMHGIAGAGESKISVAMIISDFTLLTEGEYPIPQLIKDSAQSADKDKLFCLTEDLYRLIKAVEPLSDMKSLKGSMNWQVSCGIININTSIDLEKLYALNNDVGASIGGGQAGQKEDAKTAEELIEFVGVLITEGELSCTEQNGAYVYELVLDESAMKKFAETIAPEMFCYVVGFEKGSVELNMKGETLSTISIGIEGSMNVLFTKVPVSIGVALDFE